MSAAASKRQRQAQEKLQAKLAEGHPTVCLQELEHGLEVYQAELEMQNEELQQARDELEIGQNKYTELYDFAPVGYFTFDANGLIREINLAGARLLGPERGELKNVPISRFIADDAGREVFSRHLEEVLKKEDTQSCEIDLTQKNGQVIFTKVQSTLLSTSVGQNKAILSSIVDVTIAKKLEYEIQEAREYAENIVETLREPLVVLDSELHILTANHSFYETFKVTPEETIGNFIYDVGNRQWDIPQLRLLVEEILPLDTVINDYEVEHDFPGIGRKTILLSARQIFREKIGSDIILLAMEDVTERKQLEREIQDAREYAENIVETLREPLVVLNFDLKILTANHSFYETFKVTPEETVGNFIYDVGNRQWDIPQLRLLVEEILPLDTVINGYEVEHDFPGVGHKFILLNARQIFREKIGSDIILLAMEDITERKQAEEALLNAGALQRAIFNSANFSSIATDAKGVIQIFNVGAERMLGYTAAEVVNKITPAEISDPLEIVARAEALSDELETLITPGFDALVFKARRGIEDIYELTYIRKDGSRFPAVVSVTALRDEQGAIIGYLLIGTDNTARKQAEEALLQAGALQDAIFNSANFSSIATDAKGVIQIFNVGAERMLGYSAAEVVDKITPAEISDPLEVIARAEALSDELETLITPGFDALVFKARRGIEDIYELTYIRKDGSRFPAVVSVTALRDEQEAIIGYLLIGTDNTARKRIEEEQKVLGQRLQDQHFYARNLIESSIDAITTTDSSGIITDVNKQMEALTGSTRDALIGTPFKDCFTDPKLAAAGVKRVLSEKKVSDYELTARATDGKETVVSINATTYYDRDNKLQGVFYGARDVTERKRLDQKLLEKNIELESAKAAAEKANLAKSDFLSSMSHELRTPLGAILGFAQLMESGTPEPAPAQKRCIVQILKAGWYLLELINEILDLALIESGKLSVSLEPVSLEDVMHECATMVEPQAEEHGIQVTFTPLEPLFFVNADRTRVKQLLLNLLSNAIKYNNTNGKVTVTCTLAPPDNVRISVRDTGAGLTPEQLGQLFQPFNRLGQKGDVEEGTGIGLVVCKRLVELMGGIIGVKSTVGEGSVFWFELNQTTPQQTSPHNAELSTVGGADVQVAGQEYTLLYVEDNPANLMLVEDLLVRRPDIRLLSARDAISGIEIARTSLPDVILMDINLPGVSGIDALKILADIKETAHIPIVALSANAIPRDIEKGLEAGFFRYLTKPINVVEFMATLDITLKYAKNKVAMIAKKESI
jgi:PAS domain S-box-containing protein